MHDIDALVDLTTTHAATFGDSIHHALGAEVVRLRAALVEARAALKEPSTAALKSELVRRGATCSWCARSDSQNASS